MKRILAFFLLFLTAVLHAATPPKPPQLRNLDETPQGIDKSDWQSIRAAFEAGRHAFQPIEGGWQARNPGQQWTTKFDQRGFEATPQCCGWTWGLELQSYVFGEKQQTIRGKPTVMADGQRLSYQWDAPCRSGSSMTSAAWSTASPSLSALVILPSPRRPTVLHPCHPWRPPAESHGRHPERAVPRRLRHRRAELQRPEGLDADGKVLPSRFEPAGPVVFRLLVDEATARYPITIDSVAQQTYLKASNAGGK